MDSDGEQASICLDDSRSMDTVRTNGLLGAFGRDKLLAHTVVVQLEVMGDSCYIMATSKIKMSLKQGQICFRLYV